MKLLATFDLSSLSPAELAKYSKACRDKGVSPDEQLKKLIQQANRRSRKTRAA